MPAIARLHDLGIQIKVRSLPRRAFLETILGDGLLPSMMVLGTPAMSDSTGLRRVHCVAGADWRQLAGGKARLQRAGNPLICVCHGLSAGHAGGR